MEILLWFKAVQNDQSKLLLQWVCILCIVYFVRRTYYLIYKGNLIKKKKQDRRKRNNVRNLKRRLWKDSDTNNGFNLFNLKLISANIYLNEKWHLSETDGTSRTTFNCLKTK